MPVARPRVEPDTDVRLARRAARHEARSTLWYESGLARVRECGRVGVMPGGQVAVKCTGTGEGRRAGIAGLSTCGSTWACPVCSHTIAVKRAEELTLAVAEAHRRGWDVVMVTLTMRHKRGQALADLWAGVGYAWSKVTSGRGWVTDGITYGVRGWVRVVEVTHGKNGWHVHVHSLVFMDRTDGATWRQSPTDVGAPMFQRWRDALVRKDFDAPLAGHGGLDVRMVRRGDHAVLGDYFTKSTYAPDKIGMEVAGVGKEARGDNRTPFAILRDVVRLGESVDLALWHEWEAASHGKRQMTWSKGLRADLVREPELTDQELAEADDLAGDVVALLGSDVLAVLTRQRLVPAMLAALEADDHLVVFTAWMRQHDLSWTPPPC